MRSIANIRVQPVWPVRPALHLFTLAVCFLFAAGSTLAQDDYRKTLHSNNRTLELQISSEFSPAQREHLIAWLDYISTSLLQVYGHWPRQTWRVSVTPASSTNTDPIPWAQVNRDKIDSVEFFTAPQATTEQLVREWTGYHELAHLLIPYRGWGDNWFSEGLASYYQTILQARSGILNEQQAWQEIFDGFRRGEADSGFDGRKLYEVSDAMREDGGFMRVYWSGAWYFLAVDIRLRQQSGGKNSLDLALEKLNHCCADESMSVPQIISKLDELNQVLLFQQLYDRVNTSTKMPSFEKIFASIGVTVVDDKVLLQDAGPGALLRQQIVQPRPL
ncbi:MAG: hypothetical protein R3E64_10300 [Halioglobus sp.]